MRRTLVIGVIVTITVGLSLYRWYSSAPLPVPTATPPPRVISITHVLSPFTADPQSSVAFQQQVVAQSLAAALKMARAEGIQVEIFGITTPAERSAVLPPLIPLALLNRTLADVLSGAKGLVNATTLASLPILRDILNVAHARGRGRFLVYTNADIAVQRHFYVALRDAYLGASDMPFVLLRRTLPDSLTSLADMYRHAANPQLSKGHSGDDCFVFLREWVPKLRIADVALGYPPVGYLLSANLRRLHPFFARHDAMLTFHVGDEQSWARNRDAKQHYAVYQFVQAARAVAADRIAGEPDWRADQVQAFLVEPFPRLCECALNATVQCAGQWLTLATDAREACGIYARVHGLHVANVRPSAPTQALVS